MLWLRNGLNACTTRGFTVVTVPAAETAPEPPITGANESSFDARLILDQKQSVNNNHYLVLEVLSEVCVFSSLITVLYRSDGAMGL